MQRCHRRRAVGPSPPARPRSAALLLGSGGWGDCLVLHSARVALSSFSPLLNTMNGMRILVVDDEPAVRESLRRALSLEGYDVDLAADGAEALDAVAGHADPDAILLDVLMPRVDGLEVARRLRAKGVRTPILMLTARDEVQDRV